MIGVEDAFETENKGFVITDPSTGSRLFYFTTFDGNPTGQSAPVNTWVFSRTTQLIYYKFGAGNNDWRQIRAQDIAFDVSSLTANSQDLVGLTQTFQVISALANRHFGKHFQTTISTGTFTTTSAAFQTIGTLVTPSLPSGTYLIISNAKYQKSLVSSRCETRILLNGSTSLALSHTPLPDDDFYYHGISMDITTLSGVNTFDLQFRKSSGGGNVEAQDRRLILLRVA